MGGRKALRTEIKKTSSARDPASSHYPVIIYSSPLAIMIAIMGTEIEFII